MARGAEPLSARIPPGSGIPLGILLGGGAALLLVAALTLGPVAALLSFAGAGRGLGPGDWAALRFTLVQALLSAALSVALAVPAARALARRAFPGRGVLVALLGAPFLLPVIVAVFGLLAIWGRSGLASRALGLAGLGPLDIYGLTGVVLAHVFFNLPLVTRLILQGWLAIPPEQFRLTAQLGFSPRDTFRVIEAPMLRGVLPGAFILVFLLCMGSFAVALTLGGGPRATTVELAIYQALRFDFDLGRAARLALIQFALCGAITALALRLAADAEFGGGLMGRVRRWDTDRGGQRALDAVVLVTLALFVGLPLGAVLARGLPGLIGGAPSGLGVAAARSLGVALGSAALALALGLALALLIDALRARRPGRARAAEGFAMLTLAASPFVIGTGLFIVIHPLADPFALALPVTAAVNAAMALPFVLRGLLPALADARRIDGRLADSLGITGAARLRLVLWPRLRRPLGFAAGLAAALSMGDLGVIALFAPPDVATLPLLMQRLMGAYRMDQAAGVGLVLVALTYLLFYLFDRGGRLDART
jgi:thiamine transport system permease protein